MPSKCARHTLTGPLIPGVLPDFLIIGGMKCGTTSLYRWLGQHPQVVPVRKEIHYFSDERNYAQGETWYRAHFPTGDDNREWITGEATPAYLFCPTVPERVAKLVPHAKLIALLRNPVERARSHWSHQRKQGREKADLHSVIQRVLRKDKGLSEPEIFSVRKDSHLRRGHYADQLERWWSYFDRDQLLVLRSEDLFGQPSAALHRVCDFLGIERFEKTPQLNVYGARKDSEPMLPETRALLDNYFAPHNQRLRELLGEDFGWD